jgi:hypothetical protein
MNAKKDLVLNYKMQKPVCMFITFFIISTILISNINSVYSINQGIISGSGYGNNGERFGSFVACSDSNAIHYYKGSTIRFETPINDNLGESTNVETALGSWEIEFATQDSQSSDKIGGQIISSSLENNTYTLLGEKTFDNVCNNIGNTITLTGGCGENTRIWYSDSNNAKVGSTTSPIGDKIYYLFGSKVNCV